VTNSKTRRGLASALAVLVSCLTGCFGSGPGSSGNIGGLFVFTVDEVIVGGVPQPTTPHPGVFVAGSWDSDIGTNSAGDVLTFDITTDDQGQDFVVDGRLPAVWTSGAIWNVPCGNTVGSANFNVTLANPNIEWACVTSIDASTPSFALSGSLPSTFEVQSSGISTTYGMPQLDVYLGTTLVSQLIASSVSTGGTSATFAFPTPSSGSLGSGFYTFSLANKNSTAIYQGIGTGYFSIGATNTSKITPYGVDAFDISSYSVECTGSSPCTTTTTTIETGYIDTLATPGELCLNDSVCVAVGTTPTAVKAYGAANSETVSTGGCKREVSGGETCTRTTNVTSEPRHAITANYGSNTVSLVGLPAMTVAATIAVGTQPVAVALDSTQAYAYIANYGSSTISKIDLATASVVGTLTVGPGPATLTLDPSGASLWVGGLNYISNVNLSSFTITSTTSVSGQVTALGISAAQNSWVFTSISSDLSTFQAQDVSISSPGTIHSDAVASTSGTDFVGTGTSSTPPAYLKSSVVVSSNDGNGIAITSSPDGFVVLDLVAHTQIMQGTTSSPVRGIAADPTQRLAYLTAPASNSLITVPLPVAQ